jgi:toxic protein SymE
MAKADSKPEQQQPPNFVAHERRLTVCELPDFPASKRVPSIRINGKWLGRAGFTASLPVRLRVMSGCIVITLD